MTTIFSAVCYELPPYQCFYPFTEAPLLFLWRSNNLCPLTPLTLSLRINTSWLSTEESPWSLTWSGSVWRTVTVLEMSSLPMMMTTTMWNPTKRWMMDISSVEDNFRNQSPYCLLNCNFIDTSLVRVENSFWWYFGDLSLFVNLVKTAKKWFKSFKRVIV